MHYLGRLWRGDLELENAFWNWAVLGGLLVNLSSSGLFLALIMADRPILALIVGYAFSVPYNVFVVVGVWRSADRFEGDPQWAGLAKGVALVGGFLLSVT